MLTLIIIHFISSYILLKNKIKEYEKRNKFKYIIYSMIFSLKLNKS